MHSYVQLYIVIGYEYLAEDIPQKLNHYTDMLSHNLRPFQHRRLDTSFSCKNSHAGTDLVKTNWNAELVCLFSDLFETVFLDQTNI